MSEIIYWLDEDTFTKLESCLKPQERFTNNNLADWKVPNWCFAWDKNGPSVVIAKCPKDGIVDILSPYHQERLNRILSTAVAP